jgi:glycosyltransferase involved in cell wall biosynthesis
VTLFIVHHHLRPGGVRRVIELGTVAIVSYGRKPIREVVLATGEPPDPAWLRPFRDRLKGVKVQVRIFPAFGYVSELAGRRASLRREVRTGLVELLENARGPGDVVWAHNLGLGRNLTLARELGRACHERGLVLLAQHHDWWFENRWHHFAARREPGFRDVAALADAVLAHSPHVRHAAINSSDFRILRRHFRAGAGWLPNPVEPPASPAPARLRAARRWLRHRVGDSSPVWLLPCRLLRRKNIAEAWLLTRWLRPGACLVTTGGPSSAEEHAYSEALGAAARRHRWNLHLGVLRGNDARSPSVADLMAVSEVVLFTSLQEGFGLPLVEAAAARRPLIARELTHIAPDLAEFGFRFPQHYREVRIDPSLFDWHAERTRQAQGFAEWKGCMPRAVGRLAAIPAILAADSEPGPVPFSRLTLTAQLEVLARPVERSWQCCAPLNPFLESWRELAARGRLRATPWPRSGARGLGERAWARRADGLLGAGIVAKPTTQAGRSAQAEFLRQRLGPSHIYPLLWSPRVSA